MNYRVKYIIIVFSVLFLFSCNLGKKEKKITASQISYAKPIQNNDTVIIDCNYNFADAVKGSSAPAEVIEQLQLINVKYYSTDNKLHQGQILTNKVIANDILALFDFILTSHFPIAKAIPIVKYNWNDDLSMADNNTSSFCYRDISYSKHAQGMAIDINPFFNPLIWRKNSLSHQNKPLGAKYDTKVPGTFFSKHPVVLKCKSLGFRWGHYFSKKYDNHHFEK